jgi:LPS export ABC transporter protein LptC
MLPANVDMRLGNLTLNETDGEGRAVAVKAESAHYFKGGDYFLLNDVAADIDSQGSAYSVSAKSGRYEPKDKVVVLTGGVRATDSMGRVLTSGRLDLDMDNGAFKSEAQFCLENPSLSLSGQSFVYDSKNQLLTVEGRVFMLITQPPEEEPREAKASEISAPAAGAKPDLAKPALAKPALAKPALAKPKAPIVAPANPQEPKPGA